MHLRAASLCLVDSVGSSFPFTDSMSPLRTGVSGAPDLWMYVEGGKLAEKTVLKVLLYAFLTLIPVLAYERPFCCREGRRWKANRTLRKMWANR